MDRPRFYADPHNSDEHGRARLTCNGTRRDLAELGIELSEGLKVTLYTDDEGNDDPLLIDATVEFDPESAIWVARYDESTWRHESEERGDSKS